MLTKIKRLITRSIGAARAIIEGDFYPTNLQNQLTILQSLQSALQRLDAIERNEAISSQQISEITTQLSNVAITLGAHLGNWKLESDQNAPEERIIEFLFPRLHNKTILDVGAHRGTFTSQMLAIGGCTVYAFEPHPELAKDLINKYEADKRVIIIPAALSSEDGSAELNLVRKNNQANLDVDTLLFSSLKPHNMPAGLEFHGSVRVSVRSLQSLTDERIVPQKVGLLKVDTEGHDLMVFKGMPKGTPYEMLMNEFWSDDFVFATPDIPRHEEVQAFLRERGYGFSISILRSDKDKITFLANRPVGISKTWGNTLYFRDVALFDAAYSFVKNVIPQNF